MLLVWLAQSSFARGATLQLSFTGQVLIVGGWTTQLPSVSSGDTWRVNIIYDPAQAVLGGNVLGNATASIGAYEWTGSVVNFYSSSSDNYQSAFISFGGAGPLQFRGLRLSVAASEPLLPTIPVETTSWRLSTITGGNLEIDAGAVLEDYWVIQGGGFSSVSLTQIPEPQIVGILLTSLGIGLRRRRVKY
jgi:hypothetical protein